MKVPTCNYCGSTEVLVDAYAEWDYSLQEWSVANTFDKGAICNDCDDGYVDGKTTLKWRKHLMMPANFNEYGYTHGEDRKGIGDINSTAPGTGARYNAEKPPVAFIPIEQWCQYYKVRNKNVSSIDGSAEHYLRVLSSFQKRNLTAAELLSHLELVNLLDAAHVFKYGSQKYAAWNWTKGMPWSEVIASCTRHLIKLCEGKLLDEESGLNHWGHVACNVMILVHYELYYQAGDDRPPEWIWGNDEED